MCLGSLGLQFMSAAVSCLFVKGSAEEVDLAGSNNSEEITL